MTDLQLPPPPGSARPTADTPVHRNNLDALRLALAVAVVFSHSYPLSRGTSDYEPLDRVTRHGFDLGKVAVVGFFAISGMLVAQSWARTGSAARFLEKRALRILPGYAVAVAACLLAAGPVVGWTTARWRQLVVAGLELEPLRADGLLGRHPFPNVLNGSLWTIRYELYCYLILAALGAFGGLARPGRCAVALAAAMLLVVADRFSSHLPFRTSVAGIGDLTAWARFLPAFMAGVLLHHLRPRVPLRWWVAAGAVAVPALLFRFHFGLAGRLVVPFSIAYGVVYIGFHPRLRLHGFGKHGDFSYGTYLYAWPIQQGFVWLVPGVGPTALFLLAAPLAVAAGVVSWHGVERPALRLKPRNLLGRGPSSAATSGVVPNVPPPS